MFKISFFFLMATLGLQLGAQAQEAAPCFRLEGVQMPCGGAVVINPGSDVCRTTVENPCPGAQDPRARAVCENQPIPGLSETIISRCVSPTGEVRPERRITRACRGVKCCETCVPQCQSTRVCRGTEWERECPGTNQQPDCSQQPSCSVVTSTQTQTVNSRATCSAPSGAVRECGSPNPGTGENCSCVGSCRPGANQGACTFNGSSPGCTTQCTCGPGQLIQQSVRLNYCVAGQPSQCIVTRSAPQVSNGRCGCSCPAPGGNLGLPECGGQSCSPSPRPETCTGP